MFLMYVCVAGLVLGAAGCKHNGQAISTAPSRAELPPPNRDIPTLSAKIGVEGEFSNSGTLPIPVFPKIEPTPEQRKILGEPPPEPVLDVLAFHRPPRGPDQGVASEEPGVIAAVFGWGGSAVGLENPYTSSGVLGVGGVSAAEYSVKWTIAQPGRMRDPVGAAGPGWRVSVGEGLPSHIAARAKRY